MFHIHRKSSIPLTEQICREFSDRIRTAILAPGSRLPSVRELSEALNVSHVTVVHAYRLLEAQGLVKSVHGKGTFVQIANNQVSGNLSGSGHKFDWQLAISLPSTCCGFGITR